MNERINKILTHPKYEQWLQKNEACEIDRLFCKHQMSHFLDTARIAYILNLEQNLGIPKDILYAAALLHDIGRWEQYKNGVPHHKASAKLCVEILRESGYTEEEIKSIVTAILEHTKGPKDLQDHLAVLLFTADKKSRSCFDCKMKASCDWTHQKKNLEIHY